MVLKYTQPCSHIDKSLQNIVAELQCLFGDDASGDHSSVPRKQQPESTSGEATLREEAPCVPVTAQTAAEAATMPAAAASQPSMPSPRGVPTTLAPKSHVTGQRPLGLAAHAWSRNIACNDAMVSEMARDALTGRRGSLPPDAVETQPLIVDCKGDKGDSLAPKRLVEDDRKAADEEEDEEEGEEDEEEDAHSNVGGPALVYRAGHLDSDLIQCRDKLPRLPQEWHGHHSTDGPSASDEDEDEGRPDQESDDDGDYSGYAVPASGPSRVWL